jgi:hypothetical protein
VDILEQIAAFHGVLPRQKSLEAVTAWWARVEGIEAAIATDPRASAYEKGVLNGLKRAVSEAIMNARDFGRDPDISRISAPLTALQQSIERRKSIERRTTAPDGRPIRS